MEDFARNKKIYILRVEDWDFFQNYTYTNITLNNLNNFNSKHQRCACVTNQFRTENF